jgi:hypothetical protein
MLQQKEYESRPVRTGQIQAGMNRGVKCKTGKANRLVPIFSRYAQHGQRVGKGGIEPLDLAICGRPVRRGKKVLNANNFRQ